MAGARLSVKVDRRALTRVHTAAANGLDDAAEFLLEEANRTAPIEEAVLIGSGFVDVDRTQLQAVVAYDTPYAVRQHEDLSFRHDPGRRAKWLEHTFKEQAQRVRQFIAAQIRGAMR